MSFEKVLKSKSILVETYLKQYFQTLSQSQSSGLDQLIESMKYSTLQKGGKRFRPILSLLLGEVLNIDEKKILPFGSAVELIHTYSLIHDDLPCLDNDDFRRGEPTNHKVYGEATALLAGDALLTESFAIISNNYQNNSNIGLRLVSLISEAAGVNGMVGGQSIDMFAQSKRMEYDQLKKMQLMKTAALIRLSCEGVGIIAERPKEEIERLREFGSHLGFSFQIADDILDFDENSGELCGLPEIIGLEKTKKLLEEISQQAMKCIGFLGEKAEPLLDIVRFNLNRTY